MGFFESFLALKKQQNLQTIYPSVLYVLSDLFPHERALEEGNEAEERRLCYVAITRAKRELSLTYAEKRRDGKVMRPHAPSKFLDEMPKECVSFCKPDDLYVRLSSADAAAFLLS